MIFTSFFLTRVTGVLLEPIPARKKKSFCVKKKKKEAKYNFELNQTKDLWN